VTPMHTSRENGVNARSVRAHLVAAPSERNRHEAGHVASPGG